MQLQGIVTAARDRTVLSCTGDLAVMSGFQASVNSPLFGQEKKGKSVKELSGSVNIAKSAADASKEVSALGHSAARLCLQRSLQSSIEGSLPATVKSVRVQVATTSVPGVPSGGVTYRENVYATVSGPEHLAGIGVVTFFAVGRMSATVNALSLGQPSSPASEVTAAVKSMVARARRAGV